MCEKVARPRSVARSRSSAYAGSPAPLSYIIRPLSDSRAGYRHRPLPGGPRGPNVGKSGVWHVRSPQARSQRNLPFTDSSLRFALPPRSDPHRISAAAHDALTASCTRALVEPRRSPQADYSIWLAPNEGLKAPRRRSGAVRELQRGRPPPRQGAGYDRRSKTSQAPPGPAYRGWGLAVHTS
jgi:hypothetical protein